MSLAEAEIERIVREVMAQLNRAAAPVAAPRVPLVVEAPLAVSPRKTAICTSMPAW